MTKNKMPRSPMKSVRIPMTGGKISAFEMVKGMIASGCPMQGTPLAAQLTAAERAELGL